MQKIIHSDYLDALKKIPDKSIDCILTDPPYGVTRAGWDIALNLSEFWAEIKRIRKDSTPILIFCQIPFSIALGASNLKELRCEIIYEKTKAGGFLNSKVHPLRAHENIFLFYKKTGGYNVVKNKRKKVSIRIKSINSGLYGIPRFQTHKYESSERFPRSVIKIDNVPRDGYKFRKYLHPTEKPVALLEHLLRLYSKPNALVLDPFAGSGSTGVACKNLNRQFILIEKEQKFVDICKNRLTL